MKLYVHSEKMLPNTSGTSSKKTRDKHLAMLAERWQECTGNSYYVVNRILLLCVGLWPYQKSSHRQTLIAIITVMFSCSTIFQLELQRVNLLDSVRGENDKAMEDGIYRFQLTTFVTTKFTMDLLMHVLAYSVPSFVYMLKYNLICIKAKKMRDIMECVRCDWDELNNTQEIEIIKKYTNIGRYFTLSSIWFLCMAGSGFVIAHFIPSILDMATASVNESRPRVLPIRFEIFLDQQKYYFLILSGICVVLLIGITTVLAVETLLISCIHHANGLFEIANYRIELAFRKKRGLQNDVGSPTKRNSVDGVISAVVMYRRALEFVELTKACFTLSYTAMLPLGILSMSVNLYHFYILLTSSRYYEMGVSFISVLAHWCYMFFMNYLGQKVIDQSSEIFHRSYSARWYTSSLRAQKLITFVMQRGSRHSGLIFGGLFIASLEGFAKLSSMSISYFMMFLSVQDR